MTAPLSPPLAIARTGYGEGILWDEALDRAVEDLGPAACDLVLVFASSAFQADMPALARRLWSALGAPVVFGASGPSLIIDDVEREETLAVALMALNLPAAIIATARISSSALEHMTDPASLQHRLNVLPEDVSGWIVLANPFRFDTGALVDLLGEAYPSATIIGGLISPDPESRTSSLLLNADAYGDGAILLGLGGPYTLFPLLSHGTDPLGEPWTITGVQGEWIETIGNRPALALIDETLRRIPEDLRDRTRANLLVGFAIDEYRHDFVRSDFVIRSITGIDQTSGAIATGYHPEIGQTLQFQLRDAATSDLDLTLCLDGARLELTGRRPIAGFAFTNDGRGRHLFAARNHDTTLIRKKFPLVPIVGVATSAEIGPATARTILNTGSLTLGLLIPN